MTEAEHAVREAAARIPADLATRFATATELSSADREAILALARDALGPFLPDPESKSGAKMDVPPRDGLLMPAVSSWLRTKLAVHDPLPNPPPKESDMQIMINTGHNIEGRETLSAEVSAVVEGALSQVSDRITRVEVHLSDENGQERGGRDKRCMLEARIEGRQPLAVTDQAESLEQAVEGAAGKLARLIENTFGRDARSDERRS